MLSPPERAPPALAEAREEDMFSVMRRLVAIVMGLVTVLMASAAPVLEG